jgi:hypothetical protein
MPRRQLMRIMKTLCRMVGIVLFATPLSGGLGHQKPTATAFSSDGIELTAKVLRQSYCRVGTGGLPMLKFTLSLQFKNLKNSPINLNNINVADSVLVAKSAHNLRTGRYEPGSRIVDRITDSHGSAASSDTPAVSQTIDPGGALEIETTKIWIRVVADKSQRELGVSSGKHYMQLHAEVQVSNGSAASASVILVSQPTSFLVDGKPTFGVCN